MKKYTNPKSLKGQDKINRITDLMSRMTTLNESTSLSEIDFIKKGPNGIVYGIIRENHNYFIKTTEKTSGTLVSEDFEYSGGIKNKYDERYHSYAEALKHLNMKFDMLNESYGIETGTNLFESDGVPTGNASGMASGVAGMGFVMEEDDEEGEVEEEVKEGDPQIIADDEGPIDEKTVIKVDAPAPPPVEAPVEDEVEADPFADEEGMEGEEDPFADEEGMEGEEGMEEDEDETTKKIQKYTGKVGQLLRDKDEPDPELDKYVINSIVSAIDWEEIPDEDVEDIIAKIEGEDDEDGEGDEFATGDDEEVVDLDAEEGGDEDPFADEGGEELAESEEEEKEEKEEVKESRIFSKKQLMESFLKNTTKKSLKKVLKENRSICEECLGEGCESCGMDEHHNLSDKEIGYDRNEYVTMKEEGMDVMDAIATGQGYLGATGDLDRDYDGIPNRLDMDADGDSELDFEMGSDDGEGFIELDFDSIMGTEAPVKEPDIKEPTTRPGPGEGDKWKTIKRPKVDPRPKARRDRGDRPKPPRRSFRRKGMFR